MKRKLALLLAVVMMLSLLPMTAFAVSTTNELSRTPVSVAEKTAFGYGTSGGNTSYIASGAYVKPTDLIIKLTAPITAAPSQFRLRLDGAEWNIVNDTSTASKYNYDPVLTTLTGVSVVNNTSTLFTIQDNGSAASHVAYTLDVLPGNRKYATVTINPASNPNNVKDGLIVIPLACVTTGTDPVYVEIEESMEVSQGKYAIANIASGATKMSVASVKTGRDEIALDTIMVKETRPGSLVAATNATDGFRLTAPSGYIFAGSPTVSVLSSLGFSAASGSFDVNASGERIYYDVENLDTGFTSSLNGITGGFAISGLKLVPIDEDEAFDVSLKVKIENLGSYTKFTSESIEVAKRVNWVASLTALEDAKSLVSGRYANDQYSDTHKTAKVAFKEEAAKAWFSERSTTFTTTPGTKIYAVEIKATENFQSTPTHDMSTGYKLAFTPGANEKKVTSANGTITLENNVMTVKNLSVTQDKKAKIEFILYLTAEPGFEGDAEVTVGGQSIFNDVKPVKVATFKSPVTLSTVKTDVQIGYQLYKVANIKFSETAAGMLPRGKVFDVFVEDMFGDTDGIKFNEITLANNVTIDGDLKLKIKEAKGGAIQFEVDRQSDTASTVTISNLEIKLNRTIPYGYYDIVIGCASDDAYPTTPVNNYTVAATHHIDARSARFDNNGIRFEKYINVATEGSNAPLTRNVKIKANDNKMIADNTLEIAVDPAAYITPSGVMMLPLRAVANALNIENYNVIWDADNSVATIYAGNRSVQFKSGSSTFKIFKDGASAEQKMVYDDGTVATAEIKDDRMFIPLRFLGVAFGIEVAWDAATGTAELNPARSTIQ